MYADPSESCSESIGQTLEGPGEARGPLGNPSDSHATFC